MAETAAPIRINTHRLHYLLYFIKHVGFAPLGMMEVNGFFQSLLNGHPRVQRGVRVLENHLHFTAVRQQRFAFQRIDALAFIVHFTSGGRQQAHNSASNRRLAAARLAYNAQGFAFEHLQVHAVDGMHRFLFALKASVFEADLLQKAT